MNLIKPSKEIKFANDKIEKEFYNLSDNNEIKQYLMRAIKDIKQNAFCGTQIPKRLFPKEYVQKYGINNLWKYDLPDGWRLIYTVTTQNKIEIISVILEWFNHPEYERKFSY